MKKKFQIVIIVLSLTGILIEVVSHMFGDTFSVFRGLGLIRYFTIQSNLVVFIYFVIGLTKLKDNEQYKRLLPGVVIYITITFLIFATMLQGTFEITGIKILGNYLVHYIVPILSIVYLMLYGENIHTFKDILIWISYPILYILFMIVYGLITRDFLYPFFDLNNISVGVFFITILMLILFFLILSFVILKILSRIGNAKV